MHRNKDNTLGAEPFTLLIRRSRLAIHRKEMRKLGCKSCNLYRAVFFAMSLGRIRTRSCCSGVIRRKFYTCTQRAAPG
jgi:hypothetical protein